MPDPKSDASAVKVIGLAGSPRAGGNSEMLLDRFLQGAAEQGAQIEKIRIAAAGVNPCRACNFCSKQEGCVQNDSVPELMEKILDADVICLASPIFFYTVPSQTKALIDRSQYLWARKYVHKKEPPGRRKLGVFIGVGATRGEKLFEGVLLTVKYFFDVLNADITGKLLFKSVDEAGAIADVDGALESARRLGAETVRAAIDRAGE